MTLKNVESFLLLFTLDIYFLVTKLYFQYFSKWPGCWAPTAPAEVKVSYILHGPISFSNTFTWQSYNFMIINNSYNYAS